MESNERFDEVDAWQTLIFLYNSALKRMNTKIEILNDEFLHIHNYNPIEHVKSRIKSAESIVKKLKRNHYDVTLDNMVQHLNDIAGIRVICSFTTDIYTIAEMISNQRDVHVIQIKDYIANPKSNGYKSYHMVVSIPIYLSDGPVDTKVEIQIRTIAMDFWASLEHKIYYKFEGNAPEHIRTDLKECADIVEMLDARMLSLDQSIRKHKATYFTSHLEEAKELLPQQQENPDEPNYLHQEKQDGSIDLNYFQQNNFHISH